MMDQFEHIRLPISPRVQGYTSTNSGRPLLRIPKRDRGAHSQRLAQRLADTWHEADAERAVTHIERTGVYLEFRSDPDADLVTKSLEDMRSGKVRLLNVRTERENNQVVTYATVYVADEKRHYFLNKIEAYASQETPGGKPKNVDLVNSIADIRKAVVRSFWQDSIELIPLESPIWCEVWLNSASATVYNRFKALLAREQIESLDGYVTFPERCVVLINATESTLERLIRCSDDIAEYRLAKETAAFWLDLENEEQTEWVQDLLERSPFESDSNVCICILDTGVNAGHPLLGPALEQDDCHSVDLSWGTHDHKGHGTRMGGIALFGDLANRLSDRGTMVVRHRLESSKILPPPPNANPCRLWGYVTSQAISLAELQAPERQRILCLAVTAGSHDRGRPSSWSGQLDQLASGAIDNVQRLFVVSAGNTPPHTPMHYPYDQVANSVKDPAQAWNVLTVGAYTKLDTIKDQSFAGYSPLAPPGGLSPFSSTSTTWNDKRPLKPEIVLEGGNLACDGQGFVSECNDLSLLTTHHDPMTAHFAPLSMTSASAAQAAWMAAQIQAMYPDFWPETVRGMMVHAAEWTDTLKKQFLVNESKTAYRDLLRTCGYGVPDLDQALYSTKSSVTMVTQEEIQPYAKSTDGSVKTKDMHLYDLPWPAEVLLSLPPEAETWMRVTLSYFIEPGPGEIGWDNRYRYQSHGLRFDIKSPLENQDQFVQRINMMARHEDEGRPDTRSAAGHWTIGANGRDKGSIHSDIWRGTAADLATSGMIAIYPVIGWWRERKHLGRCDRTCRYSLIVSIRTTAENVDIYTPIATKVGITTPIAVTT